MNLASVQGKFSRLGLALAAGVSVAALLVAAGQNSASLANTGGVGLSVKVVVRANTTPPVVDVPIETPNDVPISQVTFVIDLSGFEPFSYVEIYVRSEPVLLASGFADASGQFTATVDLPDNLPPGDHSITVANTLADGSFQEVRLTQFNVSESGTVGEAQNPTVDGVLSLEVPSNAAAQFSSPTLVNNRSVTQGTLGVFAVVDERVVSMPGWTLAVNVAPFVLTSDQSTTFQASNLGLTPLLVQASTTSTGAQLGTALTAGTASYPAVFAEAAAGVGTGRTSLNADLTLKPPVHNTAGTYTTTMTLTLTSK